MEMHLEVGNVGCTLVLGTFERVLLVGVKILGEVHHGVVAWAENLCAVDPEIDLELLHGKNMIFLLHFFVNL
jgi:hypothetical protein